MVCCFFAVVSIISAGVLPGVQANSVADGIQNAFEIDTSGIVVSLIFGAIVFGGVKESQIHRICRSHNGHYLYCNCIGDHSDRYRSTSWSYRFSFKSAFNMEAGFGAVFGLAVQWGVKEVYSNEAGQGQRRILPRQQMFLPTKQG
jgi:AGCS family alanine or glycine:cation symporter